MSFNDFKSQQNQQRIESPKANLTKKMRKNVEYVSAQKMKEYMEVITCFKDEMFASDALQKEALQEHRIELITNKQLVLVKGSMKLKKTDCLFSITQTTFKGLQYIYQILIGQFIMKIAVLNLNRNSDDGDQDINTQYIGAGGFGSVRAVRIKNQQFVIKRIPFKFKMEPTAGYDFQAQTSEQYQLRRCLREFCMFKICSLLGIGPQLVKCSYDLICFNNCIEFKMELCEPMTSNQFYQNHKEVTLDQMKNQLMAKLIKLHSLNIVHRDIKPENILYSNQKKTFLFGDFGMNIIIRQDFNQKTLTKFAGTADYCGPEMKELLNGQSGYVNLYLNDYHSLKQTLGCFESHITKESSEISMNNMSYNEESFDHLSDFQNFSINQHSNGSSRNPTDISYPTTGSSLINFPTASTSAPKKLATSINLHQSEIIFIICRKIQQRRPFDQEIINSYIEKNMDKYYAELYQNLVIQISTIFYENKGRISIVQMLRQWKNASRHYGPTSLYTIQILQKIAKAISQSTTDNYLGKDIQQIKQNLMKKMNDAVYCEQQMNLCRTLGHTYSYIFAFINFLRYQIEQKDSKSKEQLNQRAIVIAKQYLFCMKIKQLLTYQMVIIQKLMQQYLLDIRIQLPLKQNHQLGYFLQLAELCLNLLIQKQRLEYADLGCYILCQILYGQPSKRQIQLLLQKMKQFYTGSEKDNQLTIAIASLSLQLMHSHPQIKQITLNLLKYAISKVKSDSRKYLLIQLQLMIYHNTQKQYRKVQDIGKEVEIYLEKCKGNIIHWDYYNIVNMKVVGESYIYIHLEAAEKFLTNALQSLTRCYGISKYLDETFNIMNNLVFVYNEQKKYDKALKHLRDLRAFLEEIDRVDFKTKRVYIYQEFIDIFIKLGLNTKQMKEQSVEIINLIINLIYEIVPPSVISRYNQLLGAINRNSNVKCVHFIQKQVFKVISKRSQFKIAFQTIYLRLSLSISQYLVQELKQYHEGLKYLWRYIQIKQSNPGKLTQFDYDVYNIFANVLMNSNSYRRAIIFLNKYIFKIPIIFYKAKKKAFGLMYKASLEMNEKMTKNYYELIKNDSAILINKQYGSIISKQKTVYKRSLLKKWLEMI